VQVGYLRTLMRVGIGYDSHPFARGRKLILGGIEIPNPQGLAGHSDADAVAHALTDAILGAAGLGDIGRMFPNDDPQWKDASSIQMLRQAFLKVVEAGFRFVHADVVVILEAPKLAPHIEAMEQCLAEALLSGPAHISVKAKTNEGMGWIGRGEGIAVMAVATLAEPAAPRSSGGFSVT
jgi:2-C-methyl-D-erythritol 2,4-cyclodiphosphate synthase